LSEVASGNYNYPSDLQSDVVYGAFPNPIILANNQRYLACIQTYNLQMYLGYGSQNYTWNTDYYLQPLFPNESDLDRFAVGFGSDLPSGLGVKMINKNSIGLAEGSKIEGMAYPNPATDLVTISIEGEGVANLTVTDVAGRVAITNQVTLTAGQAELNIANLEAGVYIFNVVLENGKTAQFNVVKK
jgi:acetyltransferase-like isoleucine patch superfamily enzyme